MVLRPRWKGCAVSSAHFIGIRCDGCKQPFQLAEQANDRAFFADEARKVRKHARSAGWRCRAWEIKTGRMIDACPKCIPSLNWGRKVDLLGRTSKP